MSGRGGKRRGRPPKTASASSSSASDKKFQYHLLKKPKYLQNKSDSRFSTPSASRASSPTSEESSRKSFSRSSTAGGSGRKTRGRKPAKNNKRGSGTYASRRSKFFFFLHLSFFNDFFICGLALCKKKKQYCIALDSLLLFLFMFWDQTRETCLRTLSRSWASWGSRKKISSDRNQVLEVAI